MAQGDIKVLQEDSGSYTEIALAVSAVEIGGNGGGGSTTGHKVRFFDPFGTLLKTEYVANGANATAPTPPTLSLLTFHSWNHPGTNITRPEDIGAIYDTTDGKTYIYVHVNALTGLQPTIYLQKSTTAEMTINWGHGDNSVTSSSGSITIQKPTAYTAGNYTITITCTGTYNLGQGTTATTLFGSYDTNPYTSITQKVYFGANTTLLNASVFYNHFGIDAITVSSGITGNIELYAFLYCTSLTSLTLPSGITGNIGEYAFADCYALASLTLPSGMTGSINEGAFADCYSLTFLTLPSGMTGNIGEYAFFDCYALTSLTLPSGITGNIGEYAFADCYALASLTLPSGMTGSIGAFTFRYCSSLTSLTLPSGLGTNIGDSALRQMTSVRSLTIPSGITALAANAFQGNSAMDEYIFQSATPPTMAATTVFANIQLWTRIYVPDANVNDYKTATNWTTYADYIYSINDRP